jgi:hypothetical protein
MMHGRKAYSLPARALVRILYGLPKRVIDLQFLSLERSSALGIKVMSPLLMKVETSPLSSMAV